MVVPAGLASASWDRELPWGRMVVPAGLAFASWDRELPWAAEVEGLDAGSRPNAEWVYPNELPSLP